MTDENNKKTKIIIIGVIAGILFGIGGIIMTQVVKLSREEIQQCRLLAEMQRTKYSYTWCWKVLKHDF